jgi:hypothetical protein
MAEPFLKLPLSRKPWIATLLQLSFVVNSVGIRMFEQEWPPIGYCASIDQSQTYDYQGPCTRPAFEKLVALEFSRGKFRAKV